MMENIWKKVMGLGVVHEELEVDVDGVEIKKLEGVLFLNIQLLLW